MNHLVAVVARRSRHRCATVARVDSAIEQITQPDHDHSPTTTTRSRTRTRSHPTTKFRRSAAPRRQRSPTDTAVHLEERVLLEVPLRQWVSQPGTVRLGLFATTLLVMPRTARRAFNANSIEQRRRARRLALRETRLLSPSPRLAVDSVAVIPDLLDVEARMGMDAAALCGALDFAFAGGSCVQSLESAIERCALPDSDWTPQTYAADLFLDKLVSVCMPVSIGGSPAAMHETWLTRVIASPPRNQAVVDFRRAILEELADPALRDGLERLYLLLCKLFWSLLAETAPSSRYEATRRRIDVLALMRDIVSLASEAFATATSGLGRIHDFAAEITAHEGYACLVELLDYEDDLAKVDLRMQVGIDGRVRKLDILRVAENEQNSFHSGPVTRWIDRIKLWWRGFRFSGNELVERWLDIVFEGVSHFLPAMVQLIAHIEPYLAAVAFKEHCSAKGLDVSLPELVDTSDRRYRQLFNPLIFAQDVVPIPCDFDVDDTHTISIVTGPNSGGKTRLLQAIALAQLLAQGGWYAPVSEAQLPRASGMFVSLIDDHSADKKEGRLGSELIRIRELFETSRGGELVIVDELCSGTNPSEGEEIFRLVLGLLDELGPETFITTHFLGFARRLADDEELDLAFLQVELDEHQRPTYDFVSGVATTSLAAQTAARLGVTREELMALVRRNRR